MLGSDFIESRARPGVSGMHKRNGSSNIGNCIGRRARARLTFVPFQANVSRQMDAHYVNDMQRKCMGDAS